MGYQVCNDWARFNIGYVITTDVDDDDDDDYDGRRQDGVTVLIRYDLCVLMDNWIKFVPDRVSYTALYAPLVILER